MAQSEIDFGPLLPSLSPSIGELEFLRTQGSDPGETLLCLKQLLSEMMDMDQQGDSSLL